MFCIVSRCQQSLIFSEGNYSPDTILCNPRAASRAGHPRVHGGGEQQDGGGGEGGRPHLPRHTHRLIQGLELSHVSFDIKKLTNLFSRLPGSESILKLL